MGAPRAQPPCAYTEGRGEPVHAGGDMYPEPTGLLFATRDERAAPAVHLGGGRASPFSSPPRDLATPSWASGAAYAACTLLPTYLIATNLGQAGYICTQKVGQPREIRGVRN